MEQKVKGFMDRVSFSVMIVILIVVAALTVSHWADFRNSVTTFESDNLITRTIVSNSFLLAVSRSAFLLVLILGSLTVIAFTRKAFTASTLKLWGVEIKSETTQFEIELKEKNDIIEKLNNDNRQLNVLIDRISAIAE